MNEPVLPPAELQVLAAEFASGLLEGADRASAIKRLAEDAEFADMVSVWQENAAQWTAQLAPEPVPETLWPRVQSALGHRPAIAAARSEVANDSIANGRAWRMTAFFAMAATVMLAVALGVVLASASRTALVPPPTAQPPMIAEARPPNIAQISDDSGVTLLSAAYYPQDGTLTMNVADLQSADMAPELWVLDKQGVPHSLGLLDTSGNLTIRISKEMRELLVNEAILAITIENRATAPHAAPTGKIIGTAKLSEI
jgi:anti-sigma-K factor RskA